MPITVIAIMETMLHLLPGQIFVFQKLAEKISIRGSLFELLLTLSLWSAYDISSILTITHIMSKLKPHIVKRHQLKEERQQVDAEKK